MSYEPKPIDTRPFSLNDETGQLAELLARNNHSLWARRRLDEGWSHGVKRSEDMKQHPDLIDYEQLAEVSRSQREWLLRASSSVSWPRSKPSLKQAERL